MVYTPGVWGGGAGEGAGLDVSAGGGGRRGSGGGCDWTTGAGDGAAAGGGTVAAGRVWGGA